MTFCLVVCGRLSGVKPPQQQKQQTKHEWSHRDALVFEGWLIRLSHSLAMITVTKASRAVRLTNETRLQFQEFITNL